MANHVRGIQRGRRLADRVRLLSAVTGRSGLQIDFAVRLEALGRLAALGEKDREALLLTAGDGLSTDDAAGVLGISSAAVRKRISRARAAINAGDIAPAEEAEGQGNA